MEIIARCDLTGEEEVLVLSEEATLGALRQHAGTAFGLCPDEMELMADGLPLEGDDDELLGTAELEGGAVLHVKRTIRPYLEMLREGKTLELAPHWVWGDSQCVLHAVQMSGNQLQHAAPELRDTECIVLAAVAETPESLQYASHRLRSDKDFVQRVLTPYDYQRQVMAPYICEEAHADREVVRLLGTLEYAPALLQDDRDLLLQILHDDASVGVLRFASERLRGDRELARLDESCYSYLTPELRNDREVYLSQQDYSSDMEYAGPGVQGDRECALHGLRYSAEVFTHLSAALRSDPAFVQEALVVNGSILQHLSPELRADKAAVLKAVRQDGGALKHASPELQDDDEVVRVATTACRGSLKYASPRLQQDADLIVAAVRDGYGECLLPCRDDREVVMRAVAANSRGFRHASEDLRRDREVVLQAITGMLHIYGYDGVLAHTPYSSDKYVVLQAVTRRSKEIVHASRNLQGDHDVLRAAALGMPKFVESFPTSPALSDKAFVLELCALGGHMLQAVDPHLRMDRDVVEAAVRQDPASLWHATPFWDDEEMLLECIHEVEYIKSLMPPELWSDRDFVSRAVARNPRVLGFASEALRDDEDLVLAALQVDWSVLCHASQRLRSSRAVVEAAMACGTDALQSADASLRGDRAFVAQAVVARPRCVNSADPRLLDDASYCKQLIAANTEVFRWSERLSCCPDMALHAVGCDRSALRHASPRLRRDDAFLAGVVRRYSDAMQFVEVVGPRVLWARWGGWGTAVAVAAIGCVVAAAWAGRV